jgi:hypothetical protein
MKKVEIRDNKIQVIVLTDDNNESIEWFTLEQITNAFNEKAAQPSVQADGVKRPLITMPDGTRAGFPDDSDGL